LLHEIPYNITYLPAASAIASNTASTTNAIHTPWLNAGRAAIPLPLRSAGAYCRTLKPVPGMPALK
jgi:hypothetical protein